MTRQLHRFAVARRAAFFAVLLLLALLGGCGSDSGSTPQPAGSGPPKSVATSASTAAPVAATFPVTVADSAATNVTIKARPERIISFSPGATEALFAIGAGSRVVATDQFSNYPAAALQLPKLAYSKPDPERALALNPDVVLLATRQQEQVAQFRNLGMTVLLMKESPTVRGVLDSIDLLGRVTGEPANAATLTQQLRVRMEAVTTKIATQPQGPKAYFEIDAALFAAAPSSFVGDLLTLLKARNIAEGASSPFPQLTAEAVINANPDVILLADAVAGQTSETVCARPGWAGIAACQSKRVAIVDPDTTNRPGPRVVDGLEQVAKVLYPELFR